MFDHAFDAFAGRQLRAAPQLQYPGGGPRGPVGVLLRESVAARLPKRDGFCHQIAFAASCTGRQSGDMGFLLRRESYAHTGNLSQFGDAHTRSTIVAVPIPAPMQSVTSAVDFPVRSNSSIAMPISMAPVAPSG